MILRYASLLLAALLLPVTAVQAKPKPLEVLERVGKWNMHYSDGACYLMGAFGSGADQVILRLTRIGPDEPPRVSLFGKRFGKFNGPFLPATVYFFPTAAIPEKTEVIIGTSGSGHSKLASVFINSARFDNRRESSRGISILPPVDPAVEQTITGLHLEINGTRPLELSLPSLKNPMVAMRKCTDQLVKDWGFDPAELSTRRTRTTPATEPTTWARSGDWPTELIGYGGSALVTFRLNVDETGAVSDCIVHEVTKPEEIGALTCKLMKQRARFSPSIDAAGKPVKDFWINRVFWRTGL
ncbi:hypothetical protein [Novosphingobium sp. B 225]|uniref:hypothetical protein n=1 Tax=Novosphingobium sp. B 225 TaxID=1961849 RepID=UPI000B4A6AF0|nr:hypothetical protein [Novosphingobium sp. B 225]